MRKMIMLISLLLFGGNLPAVPKTLSYPHQPLQGSELADQVFFVNHHYAFAQFPLSHQPKGKMIIVKKSARGKTSVSVAERYLNHTFKAPVQSKDLIIFLNGTLKSQGILITEYVDGWKSPSMEVWIPSLRKVRRFPFPALADHWAGTQFTYGDMGYRQPFWESHEVVGQEIFEGCLQMMTGIEQKVSKWTQALPPASCVADGKSVYILKSTRKGQGWYDYRLSYVDIETFADYRVTYYKNNQMIKQLDKGWISMGMQDPRAIMHQYGFMQNRQTGASSLIILENSPLKYASQLKNRQNRFWSPQTLTKLHR